MSNDPMLVAAALYRAYYYGWDAGTAVATANELFNAHGINPFELADNLPPKEYVKLENWKIEQKEHWVNGRPV